MVLRHSLAEPAPSNMDKGDVLSKKHIFQSMDSLDPLVNVINEANTAIADKTRTIKNSAIPDVLAGALGAGLGGTVSFAALYGLGTVGLSAAGITSGLAAAGGVFGGGMVAGIFVLAAPAVVLAGAGIMVSGAIRRKQLRQEKEGLLQLAIEKHHAIVEALKNEVNATQERAEYLTSLNHLLRQAIKDLRSDLGKTSPELQSPDSSLQQT